MFPTQDIPLQDSTQPSKSLIMKAQPALFLEPPRLARADLPDPDPISTREREVLLWVSRGFTADEISTKLFISTNTVITHRKNLQRKMRARNTTHLVYLACQHGIL